MKREEMLKEAENFAGRWDIIIIGGGATGLGAAVDAASRGHKTLLLEQSDFAKGTSSRSTKLIHGGVRYLQQGNIALVKEALHERGLLCKNAPHLIHHLPFLVPSYHWWEGPFYGAGLKIYDLLAGKLGIEKSRRLSREEALQEIPMLEPEGLRGGTLYYDGQFDDARLATALAQTSIDYGGVLINYMQVTGFIKMRGDITGVEAVDLESKTSFKFYGRTIVNAAGVFADEVSHLDRPRARKVIAPSQGVHLVLGKEFLKSSHAIMVPHTDDNRVLFMIPWHERVLLGTTDTPVSSPALEPRPKEHEISFLLKHAARYLARAPRREEILSMFAGLRPLVKKGGVRKSASISREHAILVAKSGLITIVGGKWTTYRKMGEDLVNFAEEMGGLKKRRCKTPSLKLYGWKKGLDPRDRWSAYGSFAPKLKEEVEKHKGLAKPLHPTLPYLEIDAVWAVRHEMARTVEDVLARRTRALLLDAQASIEIAPRVAQLMAKELKQNTAWQKKECAAYTKVAKNYLI